MALIDDDKICFPVISSRKSLHARNLDLFPRVRPSVFALDDPVRNSELV